MNNDITFIVSEISYKQANGKKVYCNKFLDKIYDNKNFEGTYEYNIEESFNYLTKKHNKYVESISSYIENNIKTEIPKKVIKSIISENVFRLLLTIKNHFDEFEKYEETFNVNTIKLDNIEPPLTLSELVMRSISSSLFKEQIFTLYIKKFYDIKNSFEYKIEEKKKISKKNSLTFKINYYLENEIFLKYLKNFFLKKINKKEPNCFIVKSYFSKKNRFLLNYYSKGRIVTQNFPDYKISSNKEFKKRTEMKDFFSKDEKFDDFFLSILENFFPRLYLEDFEKNLKGVKHFLKTNNSLKNILNESFLVDDYALFYLKISKFYNNIQHIYIEHNCIHHPYFGNRTDELSLIPDKMFTLGWESNHFKNVNKGASLFDFKKKLKKKKYDILYISHSVQNVHHNFRNILCGEKSLVYYERVKKIFSNLSIDLKARITHKPYPLSKSAGVSLTLESYCENEFNNFKKTLSRETDALDCIVRSKCCIIDHLSTSFWQALKSEVPTLCFWHQDMHQLDDRFNGYFDELINANILVTDFNNINEMIYKNFKNPDEWWNTKEVLSARERFLKNNLAEANTMVNKILKFTK